MTRNKINRIILILMASDLFILTGFGLIDPILAIYINDNIVGGSIFSAGLASTIFLVTKSVIQLPFSRHVDRHGDRNDLKWLVTGSVLICFVPLIYLMAQNIIFIYIAQVIYGIGSGLAFATWLGLWSTHLDKKRESFEWSLYSTLVGIGTGVSAAIGGAVAELAGFSATFVVVTAMAFLGCGILFFLRTQLQPVRGQ